MAGFAKEGNEMNQKKFEFASYGLINSNELIVTVHLFKGFKEQVGSSKTKANPSQIIRPEQELKNNKGISV